MPALDPHDDSEELEELPPLDSSLDEEREGPEDAELDPLLEPLEEDVALDQEADEPEIELGLEAVSEEAEVDDEKEVVLDIQSLLSLADESQGEDDDRAGPEALDPAADIADSDEPIVGSLEEGTDEPLADLVSDDLPELDADEPGAPEDEASWLTSDALRDEELPPDAERTWSVARVDEAGLDIDALALAGGRLWVAGPELGSLGRGASDWRVEHGGRVLDLVGLGRGVLAPTARGTLLAIASGSATREVVAFADALGFPRGAALTLQLASLDTGGIVVSAGAHRIAVSRDGGESFESVEVGGRVARLSEGAPPRLLVHGTEGSALLAFEGRTFSRILLDPVAEEVALGEHLSLASLGETVAITSSDRGLVVSSDAGRSFGRVPGCLHATALALGLRAGRPRAFVAAFVESEEQSLVIEIDVATRAAEIVAELRPTDDVAPSDGDDGRIRALAWDAELGVIWAGGATGLFRVTPPSSSA